MSNFDFNNKIYPVDYPCWFSSEQLEQAQYLIDLGYEYIGTHENIDFIDCGNDEEELTFFGWSITLSWFEHCGLFFESI